MRKFDDSTIHSPLLLVLLYVGPTQQRTAVRSDHSFELKEYVWFTTFAAPSNVFPSLVEEKSDGLLEVVVVKEQAARVRMRGQFLFCNGHRHQRRLAP